VKAISEKFAIYLSAKVIAEISILLGSYLSSLTLLLKSIPVGTDKLRLELLIL
jgi:hypothetical protein